MKQELRVLWYNYDHCLWDERSARGVTARMIRIEVLKETARNEEIGDTPPSPT